MRIAVLQIKANEADIEANLERIGRAAGDAAAGGAGLLVVPELAVDGYGAGPRMADTAASFAASVARLEAIARQAGIAIACGMAEPDGGRLFNSAVFVDGVGAPVIYRKSHLYGDYERRLFVPGDPSATMFEWRGMKVGLLICYDVEFPENVRRLARAGADIVVVPTALPAGAYAGFIANSMIPVRAFENQVFIAYANHCGADSRFSYAGMSVIAGPDGSLLAAAEAEGEALLFADIRPDDFTLSASENTYLADLRA